MRDEVKKLAYEIFLGAAKDDIDAFIDELFDAITNEVRNEINEAYTDASDPDYH